MQLFISDPNYRQCAINLDDRRLNKQIIEGIQILSTAIWIEDCGFAEISYSQGLIYLPSHEKHPIVKNVKYHFYEACNFIAACTMEYWARFNKVHGCRKYLSPLLLHSNLFNKYNYKPFINATTNHKHIENVYEAYRKELCYKWNVLDKKEPKFTKRAMPEWGKNGNY